MCYLVIHMWPGDDDTNRDPTLEGAGLQNNWMKGIMGAMRVTREEWMNQVEVGVKSFKS